jgi:protein involved in polysaccharide export with SLBB domain
VNPSAISISRKTSWWCLLVLLPVLALGACSGAPNAVPYPPRVASLPPPPYRIAPGDTLDLKFLYSPELDEEQTVQLDGDVSFQYAPSLHVAGDTIPEARATIMRVYRRTLMNPTAELSVKGPLQWKIYVVGEVANPGEYTTQGPPLTLIQAIARAGGLKESADGDNVVLLRRDGSVEHAYDVSFTDAVDHRSQTADIRLANHDVLYVPRTGVAELGVDWRQYVMQFVPPNVSFVFGTTQYVP